MMDMTYQVGEGPSPFPKLGWVAGMQEAEVFHEPPGSLADLFNDYSRWVQPISQEHAYANHGPQVNQATTAVVESSADSACISGVAGTTTKSSSGRLAASPSLDMAGLVSPDRSCGGGWGRGQPRPGPKTGTRS